MYFSFLASNCSFRWDLYFSGSSTLFVSYSAFNLIANFLKICDLFGFVSFKCLFLSGSRTNLKFHSYCVLFSALTYNLTFVRQIIQSVHQCCQPFRFLSICVQNFILDKFAHMRIFNFWLPTWDRFRVFFWNFSTFFKDLLIILQVFLC